MSGLCAYSNVLGAPNQGLHALRVGGLAAVDLLLTLILACIIVVKCFHRGYPGNFWKHSWMIIAVFVLLVIAAVGIHELFCVDTRLNALIFGRPWGFEQKNGAGAPPGGRPAA